MRGFSTIEMLIALTVGTSAIVAAALMAFGMPAVLENARLERAAYGIASAMLDEARLAARSDLSHVLLAASTTEEGFERSVSVEFLDEDLAALVAAHVSWTDTYGRLKKVTLNSLLTDPTGALDEACSPFLLGNWHEPQIVASYLLSSGDLIPGISGRYPIADLAAAGDRLVAVVDSTILATDPTLFSFVLGDIRERPQLIGAIDQAPTSRMGFAAVAVARGHAYAGNGFGSGSQATCGTGACAQLQIFSLTDGLERAGSLLLPTNAAPYALSAGGITTGAKSIAYRKDLAYLGLEKTEHGYEFNILDVADPTAPRWLGGIPIGRSVNAISVRGGYAYLATSDPTRELVIVDVRNPAEPYVVGVWDAPGATNFGLGGAIVARNGRAYLGRFYVGNAPELFMLDVQEPERPIAMHELDTGTVLRPDSIHGLVVRSTLISFISGRRVAFRDVANGMFEAHAAPIELPGTATTLACRGNALYAGGVTDNGDGFITIITSS